jgi:hypothetical protein
MESAPSAIPLTTSIDSLVIYVLSRKVSPIEVASRIDDFLLNFKSRLEEMSPSEIQQYADSLAEALTEPIRKLGTEANNHFAKIRRYAPEILIDGSVYSAQDIPWDNAEVLADAIRKLDKEVILEVYDSLVVKKESRSKITSFVYGKTFPLELEAGKPLTSWSLDKKVSTSIADLMSKRRSLIAYDSSCSYPKDRFGTSVWKMLNLNKSSVRYAVAATAMIGAGVLGTVTFKGKGGDKKQK